MQTLLLVLAVLTPFCLAGHDQHKQAMIKDNKTPKAAGAAVPAPFNDACEECKTIVERFNEAIKDPTKMAELKNLLNLLCDETSYAEECKAIVSRLDRILADLEPFLRDTTVVCRRLHMCSTAAVQKVNRLALVIAKKYLNKIEGSNDLVCEECEFAVGELKALIEEKSTQAQIQQFLRDYVCRHLGQYRGACDELVEQFLPELFEELEQMLQNSKQVCQDIHLCPEAQLVHVHAQPLHAADNTNARNSVGHSRRQSVQRLQNFYRLLNRLQTKGGVYISCFECDVAVNALVVFLKQPGTAKSIADTLKTEVCDHLPTDFLAGCTDFLTLYLETVTSLTIDQISSDMICKMIGACTTRSFRDVVRIPAGVRRHEIACESCRSVTDFLRYEFNSAEFQTDVENAMQQYVCQKLPTAVQNLCENLVRTYVPMGMTKLTTYLSAETICKDDLHMCTDAIIQKIEDDE